MNRFLVLLFAMALLAPAVVEAQSGKGRGGDSRSPTATAASEDRDRDEDEDENKDRDDDDDDDRGRGGKRGPQGTHPGPGVGMGAFGVRQSARAVQGDFVAFQYGRSGLDNVTAGGLPIFSVLVSGEASDEPVSVRSTGAVVRIDAGSYRLRAHDNPNAIIEIEAEEGLRVNFPAGASLAFDGKSIAVTFADGRSGRLVGDDAAIDGTTVAVSDDERVTFVLDAKRGAFDQHRKDIGRAMAERAVGAEITVGRGEGDRTREEVVTFGNVSVTTLARPGNVTVIVDGHGDDGRVLVVNVDPALFQASKRDEFLVLFDNVTMQSASSLTDVLNPDDDGLHPEYHFVLDEDGYQLIVSVPHYSVHTLTIADLVKEVPPSVLVGLVVSAMVVATGGFVLFRPPRRS